MNLQDQIVHAAAGISHALHNPHMPLASIYRRKLISGHIQAIRGCQFTHVTLDSKAEDSLALLDILWQSVVFSQIAAITEFSRRGFSPDLALNRHASQPLRRPPGEVICGVRYRLRVQDDNAVVKLASDWGVILSGLLVIADQSALAYQFVANPQGWSISLKVIANCAHYVFGLPIFNEGDFKVFQLKNRELIFISFPPMAAANYLIHIRKGNRKAQTFKLLQSEPSSQACDVQNIKSSILNNIGKQRAK